MKSLVPSSTMSGMVTDELCPICHKPLGAHRLMDSTVAADYASGELSVQFRAWCP